MIFTGDLWAGTSVVAKRNWLLDYRRVIFGYLLIHFWVFCYSWMKEDVAIYDCCDDCFTTECNVEYNVNIAVMRFRSILLNPFVQPTSPRMNAIKMFAAAKINWNGWMNEINRYFTTVWRFSTAPSTEHNSKYAVLQLTFIGAAIDSKFIPARNPDWRREFPFKSDLEYMPVKLYVWLWFHRFRVVLRLNQSDWWIQT